MVGPSTTIFYFFVSILLNENRTKGDNEREYLYTKEEGRKDHRRDGLPAEGYEGAGLPLTPRPVGLTPGLPRKGDNTFKYKMKKRGNIEK